MIFHQNTEEERAGSNPTASQNHKLQEWDQFSSIEQFLDANVFEKKLQTQQSSQQRSDNMTTQVQGKASEQAGNRETEGHKYQKSIFHNFQKHLITLLRKVIRLSVGSSHQNSNQYLGLQLWSVFKKMRSYNKQTLHMVFGVSNFHNFELQLHKIASKYKEFRPIWNRYSSDQIFEAQTFIRNQVVQQMSKINKNSIRACSNVQKFETFYQYLESFMLQLKDGPITSRMSKTRKLMVVQKILSKTQNS